MTYKKKIEIVRNNIIENVQIYKNVMAGHYYMYIFDNQYFEMYYGTDNFLHLTGVGTNLSPNQFYKLAKSGKLQLEQMYFSKRFPLSTAMKKSRSLAELDKFVSEGYFIVKDLVTEKVVYPYAITNIDKSVLIGLKEEHDEIYIPKSFRIKGNIFDKGDCDKLYEINAILCKNDFKGLYDTVLYEEKGALDKIDSSIKQKISDRLINKEK